MTDAELIAGSLDTPELFGELFRRHRVAVYRLLARRVGPNEAEDLLLTVFSKAFTTRHRYQTDVADCLPWLYGIATNTVGDHIRRRRAQVLLHPIELAVDLAAASELEPETIILRNEFSQTVNKALATLSSKYRDALLLHELEGLSYEEVGMALGVPARTVGTRIHRAKRKLAALIDIDDVIAEQIYKEAGNHQGP